MEANHLKWGQTLTELGRSRWNRQRSAYWRWWNCFLRNWHRFCRSSSGSQGRRFPAAVEATPESSARLGPSWSCLPQSILLLDLDSTSQCSLSVARCLHVFHRFSHTFSNHILLIQVVIDSLKHPEAADGDILQRLVCALPAPTCHDMFSKERLTCLWNCFRSLSSVPGENK